MFSEPNIGGWQGGEREGRGMGCFNGLRKTFILITDNATSIN